VWRHPPEDAADGQASAELVAKLDAAAHSGARLVEQAQAPANSQALANAASILRWELLVLRERVLELDVPGRYSKARSEIAQRLDGAASAAQVLSYGYRFHSLDRICNGSQALDEHLAALQRLRARLIPPN
jgi:hypothetical protein